MPPREANSSINHNGFSADRQMDLEEPLLVDAFEGQASSKKCTWQQTTAALLSLQLGWGLWLFPSDFARLGWIPALGKLPQQLRTCKGIYTFQ
jgi:hypothetical protein